MNYVSDPNNQTISIGDHTKHGYSWFGSGGKAIFDSITIDDNAKWGDWSVENMLYKIAVEHRFSRFYLVEDKFFAINKNNTEQFENSDYKLLTTVYRQSDGLSDIPDASINVPSDKFIEGCVILSPNSEKVTSLMKSDTCYTLSELLDLLEDEDVLQNI